MKDVTVLVPEAPAVPAHLGFRSDIEGLRGLAVLVVVLFHAGLAGLVGGFVGVDVFFVISGFLITGLLLRERERTGRIGLLGFYARRARRLLPAAIVVLVATLIVALQVVDPLDRPAVGLDGVAAALSIGTIRFALASGDYFTTVATPSPFLHFWSLAVEEQFYLVWPALLVLVARGVHARRRVMAVLIVVASTSFIANLVVTDVAVNWAFYSLPTRAWELGLGGMLAVGAVTVGRIRDPIVGVAGWLGLGAITIATLTLDSSIAYPGTAALLPSLGAVALIAGGSRRFGPGRVLSVGPLRFLGKISYSLYLVHWPVLVLAPIVIGREPTDVARAGLVGLSVIVAVGTWALIERPFRQGWPSLSRRPARTVSVGIASLLAFILIAGGPTLGLPAATTAAAADPASLTTAEVDSAWPDAVDGSSPVLSATQHGSTAAHGTLGVPATPSSSSTATPTPPPVAAPDASTTGALPAGVKPALARARSDEERLRADGCLAFELDTKPAVCVYGVKTGVFTVALVGDSHAAQWFPALERLAKHEGWRVVTFVKVACPFIDMPVSNVALKREYRECAAFGDATVAALRKLQPDLTLVSMSRIAIRPIRSSDDTVAKKGAALARMLDQIPGRIALIVDTPYARLDIPACLSAHAADVEACSIPKATAGADDLGDLEAVAAKATGAGLIDLTQRVCIGYPCPVVVNGMIVFRDTGHLTATFSRSLAPALGAAIASLPAAAP